MGETFLESELKYLSDSFEEITIVTTQSTQGFSREIPVNCNVMQIDSNLSFVNKLFALFGLFSTVFVEELFYVVRTLKKRLTPKMLFTMLISLQNARKICKFLGKNVPFNSNTIFYSYWAMDSAVALALLKEKHKSLVAISRCHGWDVYFEASTINYIPYRKLLNQQLDRIYPISERGLQYAQTHWKIDFPSKFQVSKLGVEPAPFLPNRMRSDVFTLVSCSNVIPLKRLDLIVKALGTIEDKPIKWVHFGDGNLLEELKKSTHSVSSHLISIEFKGRISNQNVLKWYCSNQVDLFINVSSTEGIPVSIMEAMANGIPVAATDVGGNSEIVNNQNGWLLDANPTIESIRLTIISCMNLSKEDHQLKSKASLNTWHEHFNANKNFKEFIHSLEMIKGDFGSS